MYDVRSRLLPAGTAGDTTALLKTPSSKSRFQSVNVASSSPMSSGMIALGVSSIS